jgi:hypothetical protein
VRPETWAAPGTVADRGLVVGRPRALHRYTHHETSRGCPARWACGTSERCRARRGRSLWREPVCCRGTDVCWMETKRRNPHDGRMVDALALAADEGRGHAAKCPGEALAASDPGISEWGNPPGARPGTLGAIPKRAPGELKHLSTPRNREDSLSSGERTGRSPNPAGGIACRRCLRGVGRVGWRGRQPPRRAHTFEPKTAGTGHRRG